MGRRQSTFLPSSSLTGAEIVDVIQGGKNRRTTVTAFLAAALGTYAPLAGDSRFLPATRFVASAGSPTLGTAGAGGRLSAWQLDATAPEQVTAVYDLPNGWLTYAIDLYWSNSGAGAGAVYWQFNRSARGNGDDLNLGDVAVTLGAVTAPLVDVLKVTEAVATITIDATKPLKHFRVYRAADNGADTLANDCAFLGLMLRRLT